MSDEITMTVEMRASSAPTWLRCSAKAEWQQRHPRQEGGPKSAAIDHGERVHGNVTGHKNSGGRVRYDGKTRTAKEAVRQTEDATEAVNKWLEDHDWIVVDREIELKARFQVEDMYVDVEGHIDLLLERATAIPPYRAIVDLKTGARRPTASWPQIAVYSLLWWAKYQQQLRGGILWAPRGKPAQAIEMSPMRDGKSLCDYGRLIVKQRARVAKHGAMPRPGLDCAMCEVPGCIAREGWGVVEGGRQDAE